jgi:hypothetical protein
MMTLIQTLMIYAVTTTTSTINAMASTKTMNTTTITPKAAINASTKTNAV